MRYGLLMLRNLTFAEYLELRAELGYSALKPLRKARARKRAKPRSHRAKRRHPKSPPQ
jgi:hypothetical protein